MDAKVDEIGDRIYRVSMFMPHVRPPAGLTYNEFIVLADEPLLFHCGHRKLFPDVSAAAAKVLPLNRLRWISFGHLEADECGAMNEWLGFRRTPKLFMVSQGADFRSMTWRTVLHAHCRMGTYSIWVGGVSALSTRPMCRMGGMLA